jgi:hypothetical protein
MPVLSKDRTNVLFIHVPKTAGTTIEKAFAQSDFSLTYRTKKGAPANLVTRCTPQHWHKELLETIFELDKFQLIFMLVRHPYTRFCSEYAMRSKNRSMYAAEHVESWLRMKLEAYQSDSFLNDNHFRPQAEFFVPDAKVFKFEDGLAPLFDSLRQETKLDISFNQDSPRYMVSKKQSGMSSADVMLNTATKIMLNEFYEIDFKRFGYNPERASKKKILSNYFKN